MLYLYIFGIVSILYVISVLRYGNCIRRLFLRLLSPLTTVVFINSIQESEKIKKVLQSSVKGFGIEYIFATPSWKPIYNVESVDGDLWLKLRNLVIQRLHVIRLDNAREIASKMTKDLLYPDRIITSRDLSILSARIFYKLVFDKELKETQLFYDASVEWRKEVAIKGKGNEKIKEKFIDHMKTELDTNDIYMISAIAQPFFISPMINFSDIFVSIFKYKTMLKNPNSASITKEYCKNIILESIRLHHPFPILEREFKTHRVYIELDNFIQDKEFKPSRWLTNENPYEILPFGWGPRKCIGKNIAMNILSEILFEILRDDNLDRICPEIGHMYSGRNNDNKITLSEIGYTLKVLGSLITG